MKMGGGGVRLCGLLNIPHMPMKAEGEKKDLS